jgi:hypothetical protein
LRLGAALIVCATLASCSVLPAPAPSPSPAPPTQASDLRARLDLLLTEHVMVVAKAAAAAVDGSAQFAGYAALLATNQDGLTRLVSAASGSTTAQLLSQSWQAVNTDLVEYAIRVAAHDGQGADAATQHLSDTTMPQLARQLGRLTAGDSAGLLAMVTAEVTALRDTIDSAAGHHYSAMYTSLSSGVTAAMALGDIVAATLARRFPDRLPGDQASAPVVRRVHLDVLMQERSYLTTMATDAQINGRTDEVAQAVVALAANLDLLLAELPNTGPGQAWTAQLTAIRAYARAGDAASRTALTETFVGRFAASTDVTAAIVASQVDATIAVIDDQRAHNLDQVAGDDRAAATAMAPLADAIAAAIG